MVLDAIAGYSFAMTAPRKLEVVGIDGAPDGWVAAVVRAGRIAGVGYHATVSDVVEAHPDAAAFGIDIPLSFADRERRVADIAARAALGAFASSLFFVPPKDVVDRSDYAEANAHSKRKYGQGISRQAHALSSKIREAVGYIEGTGERRLWEVHPELSFQHLAKDKDCTLTARKKTWNGFVERYTLLGSTGLAPPLESFPNVAKGAPDDVLDACVAAWTALRISDGTAAYFPESRTGTQSPSGVIRA